MSGSGGLKRDKPITAEQAEFFEKNGYLILEGFFDPEAVRKFKSHVDHMWRNRREFREFTIDCRSGSPYTPLNRRLFCEVDDDERGHPYKLNDSHLGDPTIQDYAINERLARILGALLGSTVSVCNTLVFERGSQQQAHFDTFYMPSKTRNKMIATWAAFDPVTEANGPLFYYPGSHLVEPYYFRGGTLQASMDEVPKAMEYVYGAMQKHGIEPVTFYPNPGDLLIWHAQLLHGGSQIRDMNQTRTSLVTHYWTTIDHPNESDHIDLGSRRLILKKAHQPAASAAVLTSIADLLASLDTPPEVKSAAPANFEPALYLFRNQDVLSSGADPFIHYATWGREEGRVW